MSRTGGGRGSRKRGRRRPAPTYDPETGKMDEQAVLDRMAQREPTRDKAVAMEKGRPHIPDCDHPGCTEAATTSLGVGKRAKHVCDEHRHHRDYARLSYQGGQPQFFYIVKERGRQVARSRNG